MHRRIVRPRKRHRIVLGASSTRAYTTTTTTTSNTKTNTTTSIYTV